jgi:hypothetical protein
MKLSMAVRGLLLAVVIAGSALQAQIVHLSGKTDLIYGPLFQFDLPQSIHQGAMTLDIYYNLSELTPTNSQSWNLTDPGDYFHADISVQIPYSGKWTLDRQITSIAWSPGNEVWQLEGLGGTEEWYIWARFFNFSDPAHPLPGGRVDAWVVYPEPVSSAGALFQLSTSIERPISPVPEPSTYGLGAIGVLGLATILHRLTVKRAAAVA